MIYLLFITFLTLALAFLFYGWYVRADLFRIIGSLLLFLLGATLTPGIPSLLGTLSVPTGFNETILNATLTITEYNYVSYTNHTLGFYLAITGLLAFFLIMVDRRQEAT